MILNQTTINNAILKAKCCLANKTIEYFDKLALGIDKDCLFKESIVLKGYIHTLSNFEIVGSKTTCTCCIDGNYNFQVDDSPLGQGIQFLSDGTGYTYINGIGYSFTWQNDPLTNQIYISFSNSITSEGIDAPEWNSLANYYVQLRSFDNTVTIDIWIVDAGNGPVDTEAFIESFNNPNADNVSLANTTGITVSLVDDKLVFTGPSEYITNYKLELFESDGMVGETNVLPNDYILTYGFDENCNITVTESNQMVLSSSSITIDDTPDEDTSCIINILNLDNEVVHTLTIPYNLLTEPQEVVDYWNENSGTNFILTFSESTDTYTMYSDMFGNYIDYTFEIEYTTSEEEETQDAVFEEYDSSYNLKTEDPCESEVISQTCLTNKQVISIIQHINKICKNC